MPGRYRVTVSGEPTDDPNTTCLRRHQRFTSKSRAKSYARERQASGFKATFSGWQRGLPKAWFQTVFTVGVKIARVDRCPHGCISPEHCAACSGNEDHYL